MDIKQLEEFLNKVRSWKDSMDSEESIKHSCVIPFLKLLGYDVSNPLIVKPEYTADVGIKKGEKVDYAILDSDGSPLVLIEVKSLEKNLDKHIDQLYRYFSITGGLGILTNGIEYRFFTDLDYDNRMDKTPFLTADLENLKDEDIEMFEKISYNQVDIKSIKEWGRENQNYHKILSRLKEEIKNPSDEFIKIFVNEIKDKKTKKDDRKKCLEYIKKAFQEILDLKVCNNKPTDQKSQNTQKQTQAQTQSVQDFWEKAITDILSSSSTPLLAEEIWEKIQKKYPKEENPTAHSNPVKRVSEECLYMIETIQAIGKNPSRFILKRDNWTEEETLERINATIKEIYQDIKTEILKLGNITTNPTKNYISFKINNKNFVGFFFKQSKIRVFFTARASEFSDPNKKLIDTYGKNTGNGNTEFIYENPEDKNYLLSLIKQSYDKCKGL